MSTEQIIEICKNRNELEFLFKITKHVAETDSIGEGYLYGGENSYTREEFNEGNKYHHPEFKTDQHGKIILADHPADPNRQIVVFEAHDEYDKYLEFAGVPIYKLYLEQIGVLKPE